MGLELSLKLNNNIVVDHSVAIKIVEEFPTLNWDFNLTERVDIDTDTGVVEDVGQYNQKGYEIRISTSDINLGKDSFIGNRVQTSFVNSQSFSWRYSGIPIKRGQVYYGQIYITDEGNRDSEWATFSFVYNSLPVVDNVVITPNTPSVTDNLVLSYDFNDDDGDIEDSTIIRWFKNGIHQKQFNNIITIKSDFLQNDDIWNVDVYPYDGYEYGIRVTSPQVKITKTSITISDLNVSPKNPNPDDVLKADFFISDENEQENTLIRWYINNLVDTDFNNKQYAKPLVEVGDKVRFEIKHINSGSYVSSSTVEVVSGGYTVSGITIDGKKEPLDVSTITPLIKWQSHIPTGGEINYISIDIGTFYGASNIYSKIIKYNRDSFTIPANVLEKGRDYYVSISISDDQDFDNYEYSHFRISGSRWENKVSNSIGWVIETLFYVSSDTDESDSYHIIRINDGDKFAEIRLYIDKIRFISGDQIDYNGDMTEAKVLTIAGKNNDIKIYLNRELIINAEGIFTQTSNVKRLELGSYSSNVFEVNYKYFFYTISGYYLPGVSDKYADLQFHTFMEFEDNEVVSLKADSSGKYIFGLNPDKTNESSSIYAIGGTELQKSNTVSKTYSPINKINKSPDGKVTVCAHAKGATIITGYLINSFDHELIFIDNDNNLAEIFPNNKNWELVRNTNYNASYFNDDGFNINTLGSV